VPSSLPLTGTESSSALRKGQVFKVKTSDWGGCGAFYYHNNNNRFLGLGRATEVRLWLRSTTTAKIEFEIGGRNVQNQRNPEDVQDEFKDYIFVESTGGEWQQVSLEVSHRTAEELQRVYSPFLITIYGKGYAMVSNVIVVA
jgi:hypothetical protein